MAALPYVTSPGNIEKALKGIQSASTPDTVSQDFVKTILKIPGGSGDQITSFLKKVGFANPDGSPSEIYRKFRNPTAAGAAAAQALKLGYAPLYKRNEYMHELTDDKIKGLIKEETGVGDDSSVVSLTLASIKAIKKFASWDKVESNVEEKSGESAAVQSQIASYTLPKDRESSLGLNLSYTINLNLPATSDISVFNAIFKSLRANLLDSSNE